jgi:hypothetical protein
MTKKVQMRCTLYLDPNHLERKQWCALDVPLDDTPFNQVIDQFQKVIDDCRKQLGNVFATEVTIVWVRNI